MRSSCAVQDTPDFFYEEGDENAEFGKDISTMDGVMGSSLQNAKKDRSHNPGVEGAVRAACPRAFMPPTPPGSLRTPIWWVSAPRARAPSMSKAATTTRHLGVLLYLSPPPLLTSTLLPRAARRQP